MMLIKLSDDRLLLTSRFRLHVITLAGNDRLEHGPVGDEVGLHAFGLDGR
jgi:hypothetical protein